jgi:hypothetical protein
MTENSRLAFHLSVTRMVLFAFDVWRISWAAFNGVTEWQDHRKSRQNENQRLVSTWFGGSYQTKARAFAVAQDKMTVWN